MTKKRPKQAKYRFQINRCLNSLVSGTVLAVDPSSGSQSSLPGYALFKEGRLVESGVIELKIGRELPRRLSQLADTLLNEFEEADVLVIEDIPTRSHGRHGSAHASLLKAVGCILGAAKYKQFVEISPSAWKAYLRRNEDKFPDYGKSDDWDAIVLGYMAIDVATEMLTDDKE